MREIFTKTAVTDLRFKRNLLKPYFICRFGFCHAGWRRIGQGHVPKNFAFKLKILKRESTQKYGCFQLERNSGIKEDFYI